MLESEGFEVWCTTELIEGSTNNNQLSVSDAIIPDNQLDNDQEGMTTPIFGPCDCCDGVHIANLLSLIIFFNLNI